MTETVDPADPASGWTQLSAAFASKGMSVPAGLVDRFPGLMPVRRWAWGTDVYKPIDEYLFKGVRGWMEGDRRPRLRLCHSGQGINSFMLTLHLVTDRAAVFAQVGWGGHYTDNEQGAADFTNLLRDAANLLDLVEGMPHWPGAAVVALCCSPLRRIDSVGSLVEHLPDRTAQREWLSGHRVEAKGFAEASRLAADLGSVDPRA